jgi:hypothetical protein
MGERKNKAINKIRYFGVKYFLAILYNKNQEKLNKIIFKI